MHITKRRRGFRRVRSSAGEWWSTGSSAFVAVLAVVGVAIGLGAAAGCATSDRVHQDIVAVEGMVTARGNEPFVRYVLETPEGNLYAIRIPDQQQPEFQTPARLKVTGRLYVDDWNGRPFAHIDAAEWTQVD